MGALPGIEQSARIPQRATRSDVYPYFLQGLVRRHRQSRIALSTSTLSTLLRSHVLHRTTTQALHILATIVDPKLRVQPLRKLRLIGGSKR